MNHFAENIGTLDLLPNCLVASNSKPSAKYMFWGSFVVKSLRIVEITLPFVIVDNLDDKFFIVKDLRINAPILINCGNTSAVFSETELRFDRNWFHVGELAQRKQIINSYERLSHFCSQVRLLVNTVPFQTLQIATNYNK